MADRSGRLATVGAALTRAEWKRMGGMTAVVIGLHAAGWGLLALAVAGRYHVSRGSAFGVGTGVLAYTLGRRPLSVGFFFSLGHSSVVFVLAICLNFGIRALNAQVRDRGSVLHGVTSVVGTAVSGTFLYLIAALNVVILAGIVKVFREMRSGWFSDAELEEQLAKRGLMNRLLGPLNKRVDQPWKMYPIGLLFGLGFDTATEVAFLVLAGTAATSGLPLIAVLSLPFLFAAGMSLFDTADGCFMNFAYDWAFARPVRKVYYNLIITGLSVFVAFFIGTVEILGLVGQQAHLTGAFWAFLAGFNINRAGFVIAGVFVITWLAALAVWRLGQIEEKWDAAMRA